MTRKDYVRLAAALKSAKPGKLRDYPPAAEGWLLAVRAVAGALKSDNSRFDFVRFFEACGLDND